MKVVGKISLGLAAAVLSLNASAASPALPHRPVPMATPAPSDDSATDGTPGLPSDNPYATVVARNIFGLVPIPPPPPPPPPQVDPPPKIIANGIMNVFGDLEALFKVSLPAKGTTPAKDQSYMLSQGQMQDEIEVVKIDQPKATITFNNHGVTQEISLTPAGKDGGSGTAPSAGGPQPGGFNPMVPGVPGRFRRPVPGDGPGGGFTGVGGSGSYPAPQNGNPGLGNNNNNNNNNNPSAIPGSANTEGLTAAEIGQQGASLTPEQQAILVEAERAAQQSAIDAGQKPQFPPGLLPPTKLSPPEVTGAAEGAASLTPP